MGRVAGIYIRADDEDLWRRVEAFARKRRMPVSGVVMLAVERYLAEEDRPARQGDR
jgi:hypothetical protein